MNEKRCIRFPNDPNIICGDCAIGKLIRREVTEKGHQDPLVFYRVILFQKPWETVAEVCLSESVSVRVSQI